MAEERTTELTITLPRFDGPFELLISLIRSNEWSIDDLPVLEITTQFLGYVRAAKELEEELAGEFVEVASWLVLLKSRSILPHDESDGPSPKEELRNVVLDHLTIQTAAEFLRSCTGTRLRPGSAGAPAARSDTVSPPSDKEQPSVQDLVNSARRAMQSAHAAASLATTDSSGATVQDQIRWIGRQLALIPINSPVVTSAWFALQTSPGSSEALLLAMLELSRNGFLLVYQHEDFAPLLVKALREIPDNFEVDAFSYATAG